jgi:hypothetical protein
VCALRDAYSRRQAPNAVRPHPRLPSSRVRARVCAGRWACASVDLPRREREDRLHPPRRPSSRVRGCAGSAVRVLRRTRRTRAANAFSTFTLPAHTPVPTRARPVGRGSAMEVLAVGRDVEHTRLAHTHTRRAAREGESTSFGFGPGTSPGFLVCGRLVADRESACAVEDSISCERKGLEIRVLLHTLQESQAGKSSMSRP